MIADKRTTEDILAYLREHPDSGDTVEGITTWWLLRQRVNESVDVVSLVLEGLRKQGLVQSRKLADGQTAYFAGRRPLVENERPTKAHEEDEVL
jgi:hypothetical protein